MESMVSTQKVIARQQMAPVEGACRLSARVLKKHIETHGRFRDVHGKAQQNQWYHPDKSSPTRRSKSENQSTVPAVRASVFEREVTRGNFHAQCWRQTGQSASTRHGSRQSISPCAAEHRRIQRVVPRGRFSRHGQSKLCDRD